MSTTSLYDISSLGPNGISAFHLPFKVTVSIAGTRNFLADIYALLMYPSSSLSLTLVKSDRQDYSSNQNTRSIVAAK